MVVYLTTIYQSVETRAYGYDDHLPNNYVDFCLQNREVLACAPTGSGKTAAFILPILANLKVTLFCAILYSCKLSPLQVPKKVGFRAVVVSPTRELAQQTYREFMRLSTGSGFRVHVLTKAKANANAFGSQSSQRFGKCK